MSRLYREAEFATFLFMWTFVVIIITTYFIKIAKGDDAFCFNHEVKSTKQQCEEHHCFYDPYLERCFFSLEHARASFPCSNWSGNLTMNGYNNEEACTYHWCTSTVSKIDDSFVCIDPPINENNGGYAQVTPPARIILYDPVPHELNVEWAISWNYKKKISSIDDDLVFEVNDPTHLMLDFTGPFVIAALDELTHHRREIGVDITPFINNFSYPLKSLHELLPSFSYYIAFRYIYRSQFTKAQIPGHVLKQVMDKTHKAPPVYTFETRVAGFGFELRDHNQDKPTKVNFTAIEELFKTPLFPGLGPIAQDMLWALIPVTIACLLFALGTFICDYMNGKRKYVSPDNPQQEQVLHDPVDDDDEFEEEDDCVAFHTRNRNRMINGELLELDSDSDDDNEEQRHEDSKLTLE